ncbi:hypothetical protein GGS26DRAFT_592820 [Hypomontagnella submonticulosa]|nr:hypothetical protein GGS26DRAFT_592820 [Hypomontagnella submonticulosa]
MSFFQKKYASLLLDPEALRTHRRPLILAAGTVAAATPLVAYMYSCYTQWLALGRGGVPYHFFGWLVQTSLHLIARSDTRAPLPKGYARVDEFAGPYGPPGLKSYVALPAAPGGDEAKAEATLDPRKGDRPAVPSFVAPQRQTSATAPAAMVSRQKAFLASLSLANPSIFALQTSKLEGPLHEAVWLAPETYNKDTTTQMRLGRGTGGEWAHVHGEGSTHVTLSAADAAAAIAGGWAERHKLSGVGGARRAMIPWGYVLVYAPRDEAEYGVWRRLIVAGARHAAEGSGVEVVVPE